MQEDSENTPAMQQQPTIDRIKLYQISPETENNQSENLQDNEEEIEYVESFMGIDEIATKINKQENEGIRKDIETYPWADGIEGTGEIGLVQEDGHVIFKGNDSFANYQMGMAIKSSMERDARIIKETKNPEEKEDIDIGEVGEWMEKSANIRKNSQNDHDDSDEFEGIFPDGYQEEAKSPEEKKQGGKSYKDSTVQEISRKYNNMQMMMNTHNTEILNMLLEIAENGLEGDQDLATLMEQIYQAEGAGNVEEGEVTGENEEAPRVMNQEEFETLYMKSQINDQPIIKEESPLESPDIEGKANQGIITKEDWEAISKNNLSQILQKPERDPHMPDNDPIITFEEVWKIVQGMDLREVKKQVALEVNDSQGFFRKFLSALSSLPENLIEERNTFLALAKIPFNDQEPLHFKILCAIYRELTGKSGIISRYGEHWEVIGFQGIDPATDLRGAGILGLMQLLAFVGQHKELVRKMWDHSRHETFHFPFAVCGLNMTQIVKELLREGKIDDLIMQERKVMKVCNELYFSVFYKLYDVYKSKNCTIHEYSSVQKDVKGIVRDDPYSVMQDFRVNRLLE